MCASSSTPYTSSALGEGHDRADSVLLVAFGGPTQPEEIDPFLQRVASGRGVSAARLAEVADHYREIGGSSPLNRITFRQAAALQALMERLGRALPVFVGMRNWHPLLAETLRAMAEAGYRQAVAVILSAYQSEASWDRYMADVAAARQRVGPRAPHVAFASPWQDRELFLRAVADQARIALRELPPDAAGRTHILFTAHSIPARMATASGYAAQVERSARAVAEALRAATWSVAYQSRSGDAADPWLGPSLEEAIRDIARNGSRCVLAVPIGFVSDHVEVLYDLDVAARSLAAGCGLHFARARAVNDHPLFIRALADAVLEAEGSSTQRA